MAKKETVHPILAFVEAAKGKDDIGYRAGMAFAHYDADKLRFEVTNGQQLRYVVFADSETAALHGFTETGYYKPFGQKYAIDREIEHQYPNIDRVIPETNGYRTYKLENIPEISPMRLCAATGMTFQYQYIAPMVKLALTRHVDSWTMAYTDPTKAAVFTANVLDTGMKLYAVIMPVWSYHW